MEKQPDVPEDFTNEPLPSMNVPMEVEDAVASTLATPFAQPIIFASKSKAQKQREYRQRIAASRTPEEAAAARKLKNERQRKNRLRQAANLARSTSATPFAEPITAAPKTRAQIQREYRQRTAASRTPAQAAAAREARNIRERNNRLYQAANFAIASGSLEATTTFFLNNINRWYHMKTLVLDKLKTLYAADDKSENVSAKDRMSQMDWFIFDFALVHEKIDLIGKDGMRCQTQDRQPLIDLFELVTKFDIEDRSGDSLAGAWSAATALYNSRGHQCSPMLLQKRWYQLKEVTRESLYEYWYASRENSPSSAESIQRPTKLQRAVAQKYPSIITSAFPEWREQIENRLVIMSEDFEKENWMNNTEASIDTESKPDLEVIEPFIETIDMDHVQKPRQITVDVGSNKEPRHSAERGREFSSRKALIKQQSHHQQEPDAIAEIGVEDIQSASPSEDNQVSEPSEMRTIEKRAKSAESTRRWRERKQSISTSTKNQAKTAAQRMREYRERKKINKTSGSNEEQSELSDSTLTLKYDITKHQMAHENFDRNFQKNPFVYSCTDLKKASAIYEDQLKKITFVMSKSSTSRSEEDRLRKTIAAEKRAERNRRYRARQRALRYAATQQIACAHIATGSRDRVHEQTSMNDRVDEREQKKISRKKPALTGAERARRFRASRRARKNASKLADSNQPMIVDEEKKKWTNNAEASINTESKPDLEVIEPFIETIDVDQDFDNETRKLGRRSEQNTETNGMIIEIKSEPKDFEDLAEPLQTIKIPLLLHTGKTEQLIENETCNTDFGEDMIKTEKNTNIIPTLDYLREITKKSSEMKAIFIEEIVPKIAGVYGNVNDTYDSKDPRATKVCEDEAMLEEATKCHRDAINDASNAVNTQERILQDTNTILKSEMEEQLHLNIFDNVIEFADNNVQYIENDHVNTVHVIQTKNDFTLQSRLSCEHGNSTSTSELKCLFDLKEDAMKMSKNKPQGRNLKDSLKQLNITEIQTDVNKTTNRINSDISNTMNNTLFLESKSGAQSETRTDDSMKVKMSSYLFHKPRNRSYDPTQLCKNPDFNKKLKRLTDAFLSSPRNRVLLNACRPITVDVMKAIESKLFNGTVYLKDCDQLNSNVPDRGAVSDTATRVPSTIASRSSTNIRLVNPDHLMSLSKCYTTNLTQESCGEAMEINRKINQPDITEVPCSNQCWLTIEVPSLTVRNNNESIAATPELKSTLSYTEKETGISSKKKPRKELSVVNNCILTHDILNKMLVKMDEDEHNSSRVTFGISSRRLKPNTNKTMLKKNKSIPNVEIQTCRSPAQNTTKIVSAVELLSERNYSPANDSPIMADNIVVDSESQIVKPVFAQEQYQTDKHEMINTTSNVKTLVIEPIFNHVTKQSKKLMFLASLASQQTLDKRKEIDETSYVNVDNNYDDITGKIVKVDGNFNLNKSINNASPSHMAVGM
uniref:Uncharacterized protein n=1 Tax=Bombyx mori TaxID=7091 RepID=A0A8R2R3P1_BOMMO|nr:uncharacterized protein LOC101743591 isoform X3 [Bombyx mori]